MAGLADCIFFLNGSCRKGEACTFRHINSGHICDMWLSGNCGDRRCPLGHPDHIKPARNFLPMGVSTEEYLSSGQNNQYMTADEVVNIKKEPIAVDLEIHTESPDHRSIRQAPVTRLERKIPIPKDNLDLYYSVVDPIHIKSIEEIKREKQVQDRVKTEKNLHYDKIINAMGFGGSRNNDQMETKPRLVKAPLRRLVSEKMVEARFDSSTDESFNSSAQSPMSTSSPHHTRDVAYSPDRADQQTNNSAVITGDQMPPLVPCHESVDVRYSSATPVDAHINNAIDEHLNNSKNSMELTFNESAHQRPQNRVILLESSGSSEPNIAEIPTHQERKPTLQRVQQPPTPQRVERRPEPNTVITQVPQRRIQHGASQGEPQRMPNNASNSVRQLKSRQRNTKPNKQPQLKPLVRSRKTNSNKQPVVFHENNTGTYVKVEKQPQITRQSGLTKTVNGKLRLPTTQSIAQKRGIIAGISSDMAPPTKIVSGPPSPTSSGQQRRAREFWNTQATNQQYSQKMPPLSSVNTISMSRLNRMSDNLTGVEQSPSRPAVYDVLNISQEELNILSQSVKSEPTSPECDEPNTPSESCSEGDDDDIIWDDELVETTATGENDPVLYQQDSGAINSLTDQGYTDTPLELHDDEECFSDTDLLIEQTDSLMQ